MNKLVSVIIPAYFPSERYIKYLDRAILSIKNQTYNNIKITVVFNGPINYKITNAETINVPYKCSASVARNIGACANLNSDYMCFLDADDYFHEEKISKQLTFCVDKNLDLCFTEAIKVNAEGTTIGNFTYNQNAFDSESLKKILPFDNVLVHSSVMIKNESFFKLGMYCATNEYNIKGSPLHHNENGFLCEDYLMWTTALNKNLIIEKIPEFLTYYRINTSVDR